jgi:histone-binding protein RBBP4
LILGTHTSNGEQNYLMIASIKLPQLDMGVDKINGGKSKANTKKNGMYGKMEINIKINHQGEVNR